MLREAIKLYTNAGCGHRKIENNCIGAPDTFPRRTGSD